MARGRSSCLIPQAMKGNPDMTASEPAGTALPPRTYPRQRILVAGDDGDVRHLTAKLLTRCGYEVDTAEDGAAAWDSLQRNRYHLLITDHHIPKVSGVELLQKLRVARIVLPVIIATAALPKDEFNRLPWIQPDATLLKPYRVAQLLGTVREVLRTTDFPYEKIAPPPDRQSQPSGLVCSCDDSSPGFSVPVAIRQPGHLRRG